MANSKVLNYVKTQLSSGESKEQIIASLKESGWNDQEIGEAFEEFLSPKPERRGGAKRKYVIATILVLFILAGGAAAWFYLRSGKALTIQNKENAPITQNTDNAPVTKTEEEAKSGVFDDSDLKVEQTDVKISENSVADLSSLATASISKEDQDFIIKYLNATYENLPLTEAQNVIQANDNILSAFEAAMNKGNYECPISSPIIDCSLTPLRIGSQLANIKGLSFLKKGEIDQAKNYASSLINFGKNVSRNASNEMVLTIGCSMQKSGYRISQQVNNLKPNSTSFSGSEKTQLKNALRNDFKKIVRLNYTVYVETINYITSPNNKPSRFISSDEEKQIAEYRQEANTITWKPEETKKLFYDSAEISLSNFDLPCGSEIKSSELEFNLNPLNLDNLIGKSLYKGGYGFNDKTLFNKCCEIESLIDSL